MIKLAIVFFLAVLVCATIAQNYDNNNGGGYRSSPVGSLFTDPIRRALGIWNRLLDNMAQPNPSANGQLRLPSASGGELEFPRNQEKFFGKESQSIFRNPGLASLESLFRNNNNNPEANNSRKNIIDERKLLELLPRWREPDTTTTTTTTTETPSTTISITQTTTETNATIKTTTIVSGEKTTEKANESKTNVALSSAKDAAEKKGVENSKKLAKDSGATREKAHLERKNKRNKQKKNKKQKEKQILANKNSTLFEKDVKRNATRLDSIRLETESLISEIEKVLSNEDWLVDTNSTTTPKNATKTAKNVSKLRHKIQHEEEVASGAGDEIEGSGEAANLSSPKTNVKAADKSVRASAVNKTLAISEGKQIDDDVTDYDDDDNDDGEDYRSISDGIESAGSSDRNYTTLRFDGDEPKNETSSPSKHKTVKNSKPQEILIPEAEPEEEEKLGNLTSSQLDASELVAAASESSSSGPFGFNSNFANSIDPSAAILPVRYASSIMDGIGPLLLPLLGYTGQQAGGAALGRSRAAGTTTYQANQKPTNAQLASVPDQTNEAIVLQEQQKKMTQEYVKQLEPKQYSQRQYAAATVRNAEREPQMQMVQTTVEKIQANSPTNPNSRINSVGYNKMNSVDLRVPAQELESAHLRQVMGPVQVTPQQISSVRSRVINAETDARTQPIHGLKARFMPDPQPVTALQHPTPSIFASDAIRQALSNILHQPRITTPTTQEITDKALRQIYDANVREFLPQENLHSRSANNNHVPGEPGNDQGRRNVENNFYEDSGVMVNGDSAQSSLPDLNMLQGSSSELGFGGGRKPTIPFDDFSQSRGAFGK